MSKSLLINITKALKVLTWVAIFTCAYFIYSSFRQPEIAAQKMHNYYALITAAVGWGMNKLSKLIPKHFAKDIDEEE